MTRFTLIPLLIASLLLIPCFAEAPAERVFRNGKIYTADPHGTLVQAIAIRDGHRLCRY